MTMVSTGAISIGGSATCGSLNRSINIELGRAATATSNLNEAALRTLAGVPSGAISLSNFYGKSNSFAFTISTNQTNANLRTLAVNAGWNQSSNVLATVNAGVTIRSTATGTPALTINGSWPGGVRLVNNGTIFAQGGAGGGGGRVGPPPAYGPQPLGGTGQPGFAGGTALAVSVPVTIQNAGTIAGGGGGGGGSTVFRRCTCGCSAAWMIAGSGGGGGAGCGAGGIAGTITSVYQDYFSTSPVPSNGFAGSAGTTTAGGAGGPRGNFQGILNNFGGNGGGRGAAGSNGPDARNGGPWQAQGFNFCYSTPMTTGQSMGCLGPTPIGGAAGPAVTGNGFISWQAFGTRQGPIS